VKSFSLDEILKTHLPPGGVLLDFGCASGDLFTRFSELGVKEVYGVETDPSFEAHNVTITSDSVAFLAEHKEYFDVIFSRQVLYYFDREDQREVFRNLYGSLKPGGTLIVVVYNGAVFTSRWIYQKDLEQKMTFNEISLQKLAKDQGFFGSSIHGVMPVARTRSGNIVLGILQHFVRFKYSMIYFSERGKDPFRPRHFTKDIALVAHKRDVER
jgi:SAM-dependent methyltransferase